MVHLLLCFSLVRWATSKDLSTVGCLPISSFYFNFFVALVLVFVKQLFFSLYHALLVLIIIIIMKIIKRMIITTTLVITDMFIGMLF